uniref:Uncharacterized protein n=1 Tax=Trichogramma kaykai TaxID=54128 RepID=A0ABD2VTE2_9HYME
MKERVSECSERTDKKTSGGGGRAAAPVIPQSNLGTFPVLLRYILTHFSKCHANYNTGYVLSTKYMCRRSTRTVTMYIVYMAIGRNASKEQIDWYTRVHRSEGTSGPLLSCASMTQNSALPAAHGILNIIYRSLYLAEIPPKLNTYGCITYTCASNRGNRSEGNHGVLRGVEYDYGIQQLQNETLSNMHKCEEPHKVLMMDFTKRVFYEEK